MIVVKPSDGNVRRIQYIASTTYWSPDGKPISAEEFLNQLFGDLKGLIDNEDELRTVWSNPDNREKFLQQLSDRGYERERLEDIRGLVDARDSDLFDVLKYILSNTDPKSRTDRVDAVFVDGLGDYQQGIRALLVEVLNSYKSKGSSELASDKLGHYLIAKYGSVGEAKTKLGELAAIKEVYISMQEKLYKN